MSVEKLKNVSKEDFRFILSHFIIGILSATAIFLVSEYLEVESGMALLYILVVESYVVISSILLLTHRTYSIVNNQQTLLAGQDEIIRRLPQPIVNYVQNDEEKILDLLDENKKRIKNRFYGMWCVAKYDQDRLSKYFDAEFELTKRGITIHRLINPEIDRTLIREHLKKFSEAISNGKYIVTSTNYSEYEILICFEVRGDKTLAIQAFPDPVNGTVGLAIYSFDHLYLEPMKNQYDILEKSGTKLQGYWNKNDPDGSIHEWFKACDKLKEAAALPMTSL